MSNSKVKNLEEFKQWYKLNKNSGLKKSAVFGVGCDTIEILEQNYVELNKDHESLHNERNEAYRNFNRLNDCIDQAVALMDDGDFNSAKHVLLHRQALKQYDFYHEN